MKINSRSNVMREYFKVNNYGRQINCANSGCFISKNMTLKCSKFTLLIGLPT